ncbi:MAG: DMT family transporter [Syntrophobacteraceae bacterium]
MADQKKAYLYGISAVLLWSTVASAFKISLRYMASCELLLFSSLTSLVVLATVLFLQGRLGQTLFSSPQEYGRSLKLGFLNPFLYYLMVFKAYELLPAQEAQPINYTWAITLTLLAIPLLKQKITLKEIAAVIVSYCGVFVISTRGAVFAPHISSPIGVALALASTVVWALYWIFNTRDTRDPVAGLFLNFVCGVPLVFLYCLIFIGLRLPSYRGLLGAVYSGVFEMGITYVLWLSALRESENAARVSNLIFLSPFLSLVFIHFLVGERIYTSTYVGLLLIMAGLGVQHLRKRPVEQPR